jgi:dihydroflavonol-4-reductase
MTTLVTGATGFLGSHLARSLVERGEAVRALARRSSDTRRLAGLRVEIAHGDVTDRASIDRALDGASKVFHVAAVYAFGPRDPAQMERTNVGGTENVLRAAVARGVPAVYVSSVVALGPTGRSPVGKEHWAGSTPRSAYEATKRAAHLVARDLARQHGSRLRIALPVTIYGPDDPSLVGTAHRMFVGAFSDRELSMVHVDDCAEALVAIAERGRDGEEYIVGERVVTFREWFELLARVSSRRAPSVYLPDWVVQGFGPASARVAPLAGFSKSLVLEGLAMAERWAFSGEKARRELSWRPRSFEDGLRETMAFYRAERRRGER